MINSHSLNKSQLPFEYIHQKQRHGEKRKMSHGQKRRTVTCTTTIKTKQTSHGEKAESEKWRRSTCSLLVLGWRRNKKKRKKKRKTKHKMIKVKIKIRKNSKVRRVKIKELETRSRVDEKIWNKREMKWWYETKMWK